MNVKKSIISLLLALLFCVTALSSAFALSDLPRVVDDADLLTSNEEKTLLSKLDEISTRQKLDIVVVTVNSLGGKTPMEYADDFFDYNGYGFNAERDGILLLVSMENRDWWISTSGYGIEAFTDAGIEYISDKFIDDLSDGYYADAFNTYAELCDEFITQAKSGEPYDVGNLPKEPFDFLTSLIIALVIGFAVALVIVNSMRNKLKTVQFSKEADNYVKENSMNVTESRDMFLYRHVSRSARSNDSDSGGSSTHTSSSGSTHGGGGGKF